jgi:hypothetical protein
MASKMFPWFDTLIPGQARTLLGGADGRMWCCGSDGQLYWWDSATWRAGPPGGSTSFAVDAHGNPWIWTRQQDGHDTGLHRWDGAKWVEMPGAAGLNWYPNLAAGRDGNVYHVGFNTSVYRWDGGLGWNELLRGTSAYTIHVDSNSTLWHLSPNLDAYWWNGGGWVQTGASCLRLFANPAGSGVYHIGRSGVQGQDGDTYQWTGAGWMSIGAHVLNSGSLYAIDANGHLWRSTGPQGDIHMDRG